MFVTEKRARIGRALGVLGLVNFGLYVLVAIFIGGDAINGHEDGGRYFLANHGQLTEVSHAVFLYSRVHTYVLWVTILLAMAGWWVNHLWRQRNPK